MGEGLGEWEIKGSPLSDGGLPVEGLWFVPSKEFSGAFIIRLDKLIVALIRLSVVQGTNLEDVAFPSFLPRHAPPAAVKF